MRTAPFVLAAAMLPAACLAPSAVARPLDRPAGSSAAVGRLAYIAASGKLKLATITAGGAITSSRTIGPVTKPPKHGSVSVSAPMASVGGGWVAWSEEAQNHTKASSWIVLRRHGVGRPEKINTSRNDADPIGFVGQQLAVGTFAKSWVVKTGAHPHLKLIAKSRLDSTFFSTDQAGIIFQRGFGLTGKPEHIDLLSLDGHITKLHTFPASMFKGQQSPLEQGWANPDGSKVVFEQGDHTDFGGVGPTSKAFAISGLHSSSAVPLGHPGGSSPIRRMEATSFGASTPYTVWTTITRHTPVGSIFADHGNGWKVYAAHSLVVAGNRGGAVLTQPAKYVDAGFDAPAYNIKPTGDAVLHIGGATHTVHLRATAMVWLD